MFSSDHFHRTLDQLLWPLWWDASSKNNGGDCNRFITVASHEFHCVLTWLFVQQLLQTDNNKNHTKSSIYLSLRGGGGGGGHRWPMDSPHKGSVTRKAFPCHDGHTWLRERRIKAMLFQRSSWHTPIYAYIALGLNISMMPKSQLFVCRRPISELDFLH